MIGEIRIQKDELADLMLALVQRSPEKYGKIPLGATSYGVKMDGDDVVILLNFPHKSSSGELVWGISGARN